DVVLPQPEGPTNATSSPAGISSDRLSTAGDTCPRYFFVIFLNSMLAPAVLVAASPVETLEALVVSDIFYSPFDVVRFCRSAKSAATTSAIMTMPQVPTTA